MSNGYLVGPVGFSVMYKRVLPVLLVIVAGLIAVPAVAQVKPVTDLLPDGDVRPVIISAELLAPQRHNDLLEADILIDAYDNDGIVGYEYRWNGATIGLPHPTGRNHPTVDYTQIEPGARYGLQVRAVDVNTNTSDWFTVWTGTTPTAPNIIVAGDSIASGYTKQWFTGDATCVDGGYSYGTTVASEVAATLPDAWAPTYTNIAWAGAGVGNMIDGGSDSCGTRHESQVAQIRDLASDDTWNIVVVTVGINTTNWAQVVADLTRDTTFSFTQRGDQDACRTAVRDRWNIAERRDYITQRARQVSEALISQTNARVYWTGYYDISGTELAPLWIPVGDPCADQMGYALDQLHGALRDGLDPEVTWIGIDRRIATQKWAGWPHPNPQGHRTIGVMVAEAIGR